MHPGISKHDMTSQASVLTPASFENKIKAITNFLTDLVGNPRTMDRGSLSPHFFVSHLSRSRDIGISSLNLFEMQANDAILS